MVGIARTGPRARAVVTARHSGERRLIRLAASRAVIIFRESDGTHEQRLIFVLNAIVSMELDRCPFRLGALAPGSPSGVGPAAMVYALSLACGAPWL